MGRNFNGDRFHMVIEDALMREVYTTPKPGLVDAHDSGAHTDMNLDTFVKSTKAITPYLVEMARVGYLWEDSLEKLFDAIVSIGISAEDAMFQATNGVNTHKGAIFTMGIVCANVGFAMAKDPFLTFTSILDYSGQMMKAPMEKVFRDISQREPKTHGEKLFAVYGERGIRGEASEGFPIIRNCAIPAMYKHGKNYINVLLEIMTVLSDTCVLSRSDYDGLHWMQEKARAVLKLGGSTSQEGLSALRQWNLECIDRNISPGGAADILAVTIFLWNIVDPNSNE